MSVLRGASSQAPRQLLRQPPPYKPLATRLRRCASTNAAAATQTVDALPATPDVEDRSSLGVPVVQRGDVPIVDPRRRAKQRKLELPHQRYRFHPPKYYRGPLHPVQPLPPSDPTARDFVPGPFNLPRLKQTYDSMISEDIMTLAYQHVVPGTPAKPPKEQLRSWDDSSPYHKNRPKRGPRGFKVLFPIEQPITWQNIPQLTAVHIASHIPKAARDYSYIRVAKSIFRNITGVRPTQTIQKHAAFGLKKWSITGVKTTLRGDPAYEFLDKLIHLVLPKIREWDGVSGSSGDSSGNIQLGLDPTAVQFFPEVEANFTMYPGKLIPGCRITLETTAKSDRHARLLLGAFGLPFHGKLVD